MSKFLRKSSPYLAAVIVITLIMGMVMMAFSGRDPWLRQSRAEAVENAPAKEIAAVDSPKGIEAAWASGAAVTGSALTLAAAAPEANAQFLSNSWALLLAISAAQQEANREAALKFMSERKPLPEKLKEIKWLGFKNARPVPAKKPGPGLTEKQKAWVEEKLKGLDKFQARLVRPAINQEVIHATQEKR